MSNAAPIGVFDSGVGGLSVLAELRRALPSEDFVYLADTAHVPYGARPDDEIRDLTDRAVTALYEQGVKAVVNACNTSSAFSLSHLRSRFSNQHSSIPIIGLVPALKPAVQATRTGVVGVLATPGTMRGTLLNDVIREWADPAGVHVMKAVSTELVPLVEAGQVGSVRVREVLRETLRPVAEAGADWLVLGCTHYPFLAGDIRAEFGDTFSFVDSGAAVARHTRNVLERDQLLAERDTPGAIRYTVTGDLEAARRVITLLGQMESGQKEHSESQIQTATLAPEPLRIELIQT